MNHACKATSLTEPSSGGGLLLLRRKAPLSRRSVAYFCSGAHTSRRHIQQQAGRSLRRQRDLPLARLRPRQQEQAHDSAGRGVPAPIPAPPAAAWLRAHPQLRLPRQPATRHPPAALLPTAPWFREHPRFDGTAGHGPDARTLELSRLWWKHARCRTTLRRATPTPLSTAT